MRDETIFALSSGGARAGIAVVRISGPGAADALGRLRIVAFEDARGLVPTSHGFWHAPEGLAEATATAVVHQGALEASDVQGIVEMVEMIAVQRAYESAARTVSFVEESYRRLTEEF